MIEFLKGLKKFSISTIIVSAVLGVLFIAFPDKCIQYISLFVGAALIVIGAVAVVTYLLDRNTILPLILGIIVLVTGIVICAKYRQIISIIVVIFGIFILISGLVDFVASFKSIAILRLSGWFTLVLSVITIIFGIVALVIATIVVLIVAHKYKNSGKEGTYDLRSNSVTNLTERQDIFLTKHVSVTTESSSSSDSGSSGGSSSGGGGSSGGGSRSF